MQDDKYQHLALQILQTGRAELGELFPYLDAAIDSLGWQFPLDGELRTDGRMLYLPARKIVSLYQHTPAAVRRGCLHMMLHCLFLHLFEGGGGARWALACDLAVEHMIEQQKAPRLALPHPVRSECFALLGERQYTPQELLQLLEEGFFPYSDAELAAVFSFDDHGGWSEQACGGVRSHWEQLLLEAAQNKAGRGKRGSAAGRSAEDLSPSGDLRYDYRGYLRRFTVCREEVELDTESFDYGFYHFGMEHYGDMPLIEPLEYKEVHRLEELVIAIDTSGSCSSETVSRFLSETYGILAQQENFFRKMKVYFIQCDCLIQKVTLIRSREDWLEYAKNVRIHGRGGTSFTPVFHYIADLRSKKELKNLKALLYFTDGDGAYPTSPPDYETTFVLLKESGHPELTPKWARVLLI